MLNQQPFALAFPFLLTLMAIPGCDEGPERQAQASLQEVDAVAQPDTAHLELQRAQQADLSSFYDGSMAEADRQDTSVITPDPEVIEAPAGDYQATQPGVSVAAAPTAPPAPTPPQPFSPVGYSPTADGADS